MAAPAPPAASTENPYGLIPALKQGGLVTQVTFGILVIMSVGSWYIFFVKLFEQQKIIKEGRRARTVFWQAAGPASGADDAAAKPAAPPPSSRRTAPIARSSMTRSPPIRSITSSPTRSTSTTGW